MKYYFYKALIVQYDAFFLWYKFFSTGGLNQNIHRPKYLKNTFFLPLICNHFHSVTQWHDSDAKMTSIRCCPYLIKKCRVRLVIPSFVLNNLVDIMISSRNYITYSFLWPSPALESFCLLNAKTVNIYLIFGSMHHSIAIPHFFMYCIDDAKPFNFYYHYFFFLFSFAFLFDCKLLS